MSICPKDMDMEALACMGEAVVSWPCMCVCACVCAYEGHGHGGAGVNW